MRKFVFYSTIPMRRFCIASMIVYTLVISLSRSLASASRLYLLSRLFTNCWYTLMTSVYLASSRFILYRTIYFLCGWACRPGRRIYMGGGQFNMSLVNLANRYMKYRHPEIMVADLADVNFYWVNLMCNIWSYGLEN